MAERKTCKSNGANAGYEAELWQTADALRGSMDAAEYKPHLKAQVKQPAIGRLVDNPNLAMQDLEARTGTAKTY